MSQILTFKTRVTSSDGTVKQGNQSVLKEHRLKIYVNQRKAGELLCTDTDLEELSIGYLFNKGILDSADRILRKELSEDHKVMDVRLSDGVEPYKMIPAEERMKPLPKVTVEPAQIFRLAEEFLTETPLHKKSGGTHSCILMYRGDIVYQVEDMGRHNAMDKVVGYMLLKHLDPKDCIVYTSGRVPVDMTEKAVLAGIPVLVSKAIPTVDSVRLAGEYGLHLIIRAWPDHFEEVDLSSMDDMEKNDE